MHLRCARVKLVECPATFTVYRKNNKKNVHDEKRALQSNSNQYGYHTHQLSTDRVSNLMAFIHPSVELPVLVSY